MKLLKNLLTITYKIFYLVFILMFIFMLVIWFHLIPKLTTLLEQDFDLTPLFNISIVVEMISFALFIYCLKTMINVVSEFEVKKYFTLQNANNIHKIGKLIIITYILDEWIVAYLIPFIESFDNFHIEMNFIEILGIASYKLFIGIFLLGIGKAFELGLKQQQENELTI